MAAAGMSDAVTVSMSAPAATVWACIADVTRIGQFSPETFEAQWLDGATAPAVGVRFRGHVRRNRRGPVYWSTCTVVECVDERRFAFAVAVRGRTVITWRYQLDPATGGVRVTESYTLAPNWPNRIYWRLVGSARGRTNRQGMRATLERIKAEVEK